MSRSRHRYAANATSKNFCMKASRHFLILVLIVLVGATLRFWNLDSKPIWSDEILTAVFSLGRNFYNVPLGRAFPLAELAQVFTLNPDATCTQIAETVSIQSVHPPLFFCWMHDWLNWISSLPQSWVWKLRALPALLGVVAIVALYQLNRTAFSVQAGLIGAALMAVSPFAVYLSQEARHYTLPMVLITLALLGLYQLQVDLYHQRFRPAIWFGWMIVNSLGFYVHYFFLLAFIAQAATLISNFLSLKYLPSLHPLPSTLQLRRSFLAISLAIVGICLTYLPWLPTLISHLTRPETDWLDTPNSSWIEAFAPLYRIPMGWILMIIALPAEEKPFWIAVPCVVLMVSFTGWLFWRVFNQFWQLWSTPETHLATRMLVVFIVAVLLEFLAIVYVLNKDISLVPRYNFIYYPAICALLGASLNQATGVREQALKKGWQIINRRQGVILAVLLAGLLSSVLVVSNQVFQKPYQPDQVARNMRVAPELPLLVSMGYMDFQDIALGLSFALALHDQSATQSNKKLDDYFAFLARSQGYQQIWKALANLKTPLATPLNFWLVAPGLRQVDYPTQLSLSTAKSSKPASCILDPANYYRLGVPYQMYRCEEEKL
jgi:uncharacterized membrane protein